MAFYTIGSSLLPARDMFHAAWLHARSQGAFGAVPDGEGYRLMFSAPGKPGGVRMTDTFKVSEVRP